MPIIISDIFAFSSFVGTVSFALSGMIIAVRKQFDLLGIGIIAALTACGGGALRDVLVGRVPAILKDSSPLLIVLAVLIAAFFLKLHKRDDLERKFIFVVSDAIGLVAFSVTGSLIAIEAGIKVFGIMMLAFVTAIGGGLIRDMLVNEVPLIFKSEFYGSVSLLVGLFLYMLHQLEMLNSLGILIVALAGISIRLLAYHKDWHLPKL